MEEFQTYFMISECKNPFSFTDPTGLYFVYGDPSAQSLGDAVGANATGPAALVYITAATSTQPVYVQTRPASEINVQSFVNGYSYQTDSIASGNRSAQSVDISNLYSSMSSSTSAQALLAHELTHVLQLQGNETGRLSEALPNAVQQNYSQTAGGGSCGR